MGVEIERKFLVQGDEWRAGVVARSVLRQGYLATENGNTVRIRLDGEQARLTIKGPASGRARAEFEYPVPANDALDLLALCGTRIVEKTRNRVPSGEHVWEIDEFDGLNAGLVLAEVEMRTETEMVQIPKWVGREVTGDLRFDNASLSERPFSTWTTDGCGNEPGL